MTASPTPPDFFAENANKSATAGLPSEEDVARVLFERGRDVHDARTWEEANVEMREWLKGHATTILDLIRPAFEAKEREIEWLRGFVSSSEAERYRSCVSLLDRALSAEAKLAQAVEALELYRDAVRIDVKMDGPLFMGANSSALKRAWEADRAAARGEKT